MMEVFLLWHVHAFYGGEEDEKLIGVYSSQEKAEEAIGRLKNQPGFVDLPEGFGIYAYTADKDTNWTEGYVAVTGDEWVCPGRGLTSACTRPPTRQLARSGRGAGRRVMRGVRR